MPAPDYAVEIAALEKGLASGEATIESDGDRVTYRGIADIMAAISYFQQKGAAAGGTLTRRSSVTIFSKD